MQLFESALADQHRRLPRFMHRERLNLRHCLVDRCVGSD